MAKIKSRATDSHHTKPKGIHRRAFEQVYWPYIPVVAAVCGLLILASNTGNFQAYAHHPFGRVLSYATNMSLSGLLADTNAERSANGVSSLKLNTELDAAAQASADDMAARDYWSHYTPEGNPPWIWVTAQGYSYEKLGQNLATGFNDEQATIDGWMNSPEHRANMLDPAFKDVGFGFADNPNYTAAGGGPMTIVVAFYGEAPAAATAISTQSTSSEPSSIQVTYPGSSPKVQSTNNLPPVKASRVQLALTGSKFTTDASAATIVAAVLILGFWATRHLRALRRFLLKGERYAISHPLTDIGILIIGCLLFILSQTAGLVR